MANLVHTKLLKGFRNLPVEFYQQLPAPFPSLLQEKNQRSDARDIVFLSSLAAYSAALPLKILSDGPLVSPHLYIFINGESGTSKSLVRVARDILKPIRDKMNEEAELAQQEYLRELEQANTEKQAVELKKPKKARLLLGGKMTAAGLADVLNASPGGCLAVIPEADDLAASMNSPHGAALSSMFRQAYLNEQYTGLTKEDGVIETEHPMLALLIAGTPGQMPAILGGPAQENGLFNRIIHFSTRPDSKHEYDPHGHWADFSAYTYCVSELLLAIRHELVKREEPLVFRFRNEEMFQHFIDGVNLYWRPMSRRGYGPFLKRVVVAFKRFLAIITAARNVSRLGDGSMQYLCPSEQDIELCLKYFVPFVLHHQKIVTMKGEDEWMSQAKRTDLAVKLLETELPQQFRARDFCKLMTEKLDYHLKQAQKKLRRFCEEKLVVQLERGLYGKTI